MNAVPLVFGLGAGLALGVLTSRRRPIVWLLVSVAKTTAPRPGEAKGAPGDFIGDLPVKSFIHPAGLPMNTSTNEVLRRPVEIALVADVRVMDRSGCTLIGLPDPTPLSAPRAGRRSPAVSACLLRPASQERGGKGCLRRQTRHRRSPSGSTRRRSRTPTAGRCPRAWSSHDLQTAPTSANGRGCRRNTPLPSRADP